MLPRYDIIIAGGGAAGLSLACHLVGSSTRDRSILIIDHDTKDQNDRTWCFWTDRPTPFESIVYRTWDRLQIVGEDSTITANLGAFRYQMLRGIDFYDFARRTLLAHPDVHFLHGHIDRIEDGRDEANVWVDGRAIAGTWAFDSTFEWPELHAHAGSRHVLTQQFESWEIETVGDAFDPQTPTLFDFRTAQGAGMRFVYLLPLTSRHALLTYVVCATETIPTEACAEALSTYLVTTRGVGAYHITRTEQGASPLTDYPFPQRLGSHILAIGIKGGMIKPSTGYAFTRIQADSAAIVKSLDLHGTPFHALAGSWRYRYFDAVLLDLWQRHGEWSVPIFLSLFRQNSAESIFRFLDEAATVPENLRMMRSLPPRLLLYGACHLDEFARAWQGAFHEHAS
ncbi:MAG TPA: lycopene cyclase family protein [Ktedonobacterales bacterium]